MTGVGFLILFGLSFVLIPCEAVEKITSPPDGTKLTFLNGSTANITWSFNNTISTVLLRSWYFTSSDGSFNAKLLANIFKDQEPQIEESGLSGVTIVKPATLILKNVNQSYDGTYRFDIGAANSDTSNVRVFIAKQPNAMIINCSSPVTVNEGDNFTCVCRSEGGNPPANVTWYKDGEQIGNASYGENILTLTNVTKQDSGTYKCVAQSYTLTDEESIEVKVKLNFKPNKTAVTFTKNPAVVGGDVAVMCKSNGLPEPSYTIIHNDTIVVSNEKTYAIDVVQYNDTGTYKCIARNILGPDSDFDNLGVGQIYLPPGGNRLTFSKESTVKIKWSLDPILFTNINRTWSFKSSASGKDEILGEISRAGNITIVTRLYEVDIEEPATLVLKNVNDSYNGTYKFTLYPRSPSPSISEVVAFIAKKPNVTISCPSNITLDEGDNRTCVCTSKDGNPPANLTWYDKVGKPIGNASYGEKILTLTSVTEQDIGTYKCVAQSYNLTDEESIEVKVRLNFEPKNTKIEITPKTVKVDESVTIKCKSDGLPKPKYNITHNRIVLITEKTHTISKAKKSDAGKYECIAWNKLGNDSASDSLTVKDNPPGCQWWCIMLIVIAVVVVLVIIACVVYRSKKKEKDGYRGNADVSPGGSGGVPVNHYELDGEPAGGVDNAYDTVNTSEASGSKRKPTENTLPPVYAAVDKSNKEGKPLYATLDTIALHSNNSKKKRDEERPGQTEYASIDFNKIGKTDQE